MKEGIEDVNHAVYKVETMEVTPLAYPVHKVESLIFFHSGTATCKANFLHQIPFGSILVGLVIVPKCDCLSSPFRCSFWALSLRRRQVQARVPSMLVDPLLPLLPPLTRRLWPQKHRLHSHMPAGDLRRALIPNSVTQSDFGHGAATSAPLSSVVPEQSTAGDGHQSASKTVGTGAGASAAQTGSSDGNKAITVEGAGVLLAAAAFVMLLM